MKFFLSFFFLVLTSPFRTFYMWNFFFILRLLAVIKRKGGHQQTVRFWGLPAQADLAALVQSSTLKGEKHKG